MLKWCWELDPSARPVARDLLAHLELLVSILPGLTRVTETETKPNSPSKEFSDSKATEDGPSISGLRRNEAEDVAVQKEDAELKQQPDKQEPNGVKAECAQSGGAPKEIGRPQEESYNQEVR